MDGPVSGFQHVATLTNDLDRLITFYRQVFQAGQVKVIEAEQGAPFTRHALIEIADGVVLHPFEFPQADLEAWGTEIFRRGRVDHFAIRVRDRDALEEVRERLVAGGYSDGEITDFGVLLSVGFTDPDGARHEVCWLDHSVGLDAASEPPGFQAATAGATGSAPGRGEDRDALRS